MSTAAFAPKPVPRTVIAVVGGPDPGDVETSGAPKAASKDPSSTANERRNPEPRRRSRIEFSSPGLGVRPFWRPRLQVIRTTLWWGTLRDKKGRLGPAFSGVRH